MKNPLYDLRQALCYAILIAATSMSLLAQDAGDRFRVLAHEHAALAALNQAAAEWEANEPDAARHLLAVEEIARALVALDPALSLDYCRKVRSAPRLWPVMLDAEVRLRDWPMAERFGEAVVEEINAGRLFPRLSDSAEEAGIRRLYATALEHQGKKEAAARQMAIVDPKALDGYALLKSERDRIRAEGAAVAAAQRARRVENLRNEVLSAEIRQASTPFRLRDLNGHEVALADYRGKPLVAVFWATWCAPCVEELRQVSGFFERHPHRFVTVSIDTEREAAVQFAWKEGYRFPILFADQATGRTYAPASTLEGANVPQLYVFDPRGDIRFHVIGFDDDGMLAQELEWMVAAALK